jgi:hypothetical protein
MDEMHPGVNRVTLTGRIWTIDSWDGETFTIQMSNAQGEIIATRTQTGNNFASLADHTLTCSDGVTGWQDGFFNIQLSAPYSHDQGAITVRITNTLDQGAGDESIGYGDMKFTMDYDPSVEWVREWPSVSPADYDAGVENPDGLWENDCFASRKECNGMKYYGGHNECA